MIKILSYSVIAPLILPRICKDMGFKKKEVLEYSVFYDLITGDVIQEITDTEKIKHTKKGKEKRDKNDKFMNHLFSKIPSGTGSILFQILREKKAILITYFDNKKEIIKINKY